MSFQYDQYLEQHRANVEKGFRWLQKNLPEITESSGAEHNVVFSHDQSKYESNEYEAYDAYFYGGNRTYAVVQDFKRAWLLHIHRNPHHWQHWILINDDPEEAETCLEIPYHYIIEMICDWWSFSWAAGNLFEIFAWYDKHKDYMKFHPDTRKIVEDILDRMKERLGDSAFLKHYGVKGMKWGVRRSPEQLGHVGKRKKSAIMDYIESGTKANKGKQVRHVHDEHIKGRSYLDGDLEYAQKLIDEFSGTGELKFDRNGNWVRKEVITADRNIGIYVDPDTGEETPSNRAVITYSKTGAHIYPVRRKKEDD